MVETSEYYYAQAYWIWLLMISMVFLHAMQLFAIIVLARFIVVRGRVRVFRIPVSGMVAHY